MTPALLRRQPRAVYRIYSEDEYLDGVNPFTDWDVPPPGEETKRGRTLQRFAGAAALTGAVGTVGGVVGLSLHAHSADRREIAERLVPSIRMAAPRESTVQVRSVQVRRPHVAQWNRPHRKHANWRAPVRVTLAPVRRIQTHTVVQTPARVVAGSTPQSAPAPVASTAQSTPAEAAAEAAPRPRAQSEFGFER